MRKPLISVGALLVAAVLSACALQELPKASDLGPQAMPNVRVPQQWASPDAAQGAVANGWLASFNDPKLDELVQEALAYNADLRVAGARVEQAAGHARLAGSTIYPTLDLLAHGSGGSSGGDGSGLNGGGFFASWEIDLWGRVRAARDAGELQYFSVESDAEYARQSIAALVAKSWMLATEARLQRALAGEMVRSGEQLLSLAGDRKRVGRSDDYDLVAAQASLQSYRDAQRQLDLGYQQAVRALETLLGRYPAAAMEVAPALTAMPGPVPVGLPSELLERRPDVVAAERRVSAAFRRLEEAQAARLPRIALTASVTSISSDLIVLKDVSNPSWSFGGNLTAPIFNGYALAAQVDIATAEQKIAVADYGRIGARAFGEVEAALSAGFTANERAAILTGAVGQNERLVEIANIRYRVGSADLRAVQQQSLALFASRASLVRMQSEQRVQRVNLYLALGGSFGEPPPARSAQR
ncbi:MAG: efflux transporter outer membrane subunit [Betaproteobacteria bacterium]|nr:efflux transporter outer membrane subunit [Betaproteobacteria bacterium]